MHYGATSFQFEKAKELRNRETETEKLLWAKLSKKQLGVKFRRQHPLSNFIADFYCHTHKLVIELDGGVHDSEEAKEYDEMRTYLINQFGIEVIRFQNKEIINNLDIVIEDIKTKLNDNQSPLGDLGA
ncbi:MAG: endonuclease domain-containing protein [Flavobacteriales bacterium]|nr:endonuclease domain-containing protein [Flavobacteriales bacterium]